MKSKFGTALALVGVLLTGTAAAAINTQALISPSQSTLGTAATTLLPIDQITANPNSNQTPASSVNFPAGHLEATSSAASTTPTIVYGNPNPSNGYEEDDDDDDENEDEGEDDDDEDDDDD